MTAVDTLPVAEVFGPTFQGEGPSSGRSCCFVRLGGCNLTCARCDTAYTWDATRYNLREELTNRTADGILAELRTKGWTSRGGIPLLTVLTGGEPLMYRDRPAMADLVEGLLAVVPGDQAPRSIEVETNGTLVPGGVLLDTTAVRFNVSPKLFGPMSVDPVYKRIVPPALRTFNELAARRRAAFKFVVAGDDDVDQAATLTGDMGIDPRHVWIMPEGVDAGQLIATGREVADRALYHGFNLTTRLHVLLWPDTARGR